MPTTPEISPAISTRIEEWKSRLIDLSKRNRLLYLGAARSGLLVVDSPDWATIFDRIFTDGKSWQFWLPPPQIEEKDSEAGSEELASLFFEELDEQEPVVKEMPKPAANELVCSHQNRKKLEATLKNLFRRARTDFQERGVKLLYLTFGTLRWKDDGSGTEYSSPLVLCPVELSRASSADPFEISLSEEELILNPALVVKLRQDFRIDLPNIDDDFASADIENFFTKVDKKVKSLEWRVDRSTHLGIFSFHKLAIYQDLLSNAATVARSGVIAGLSGKPFASDGLEPIPDCGELDRTQKPSETFQILDADSSQQQAIQAALKGRNLVLHGPPGTGKSQTIANIISEFLARGKSVLFVSEKIAALEVVYKRLRETHLDEFCLELHSHKANKREVVERLKEALDTSIRPGHLPHPSEFERLEEVRTGLNEYVEELHRVRMPLGLSVREVHSKLTDHDKFAFIPWEGRDPQNIALSELLQIESLVSELSELWDVAKSGEEFIWYGCTLPSFNLQIRGELENTLSNCRIKVRTLDDKLTGWGARLGLSDPRNLEEAKRLCLIFQLMATCPGIHPNWLRSHEFESLANEAVHLSELCSENDKQTQILLQRYHESFFQDSFQVSDSLLSDSVDAIKQHGIGGGDDNASALLECRHDLISFLNGVIKGAAECVEYEKYFQRVLGVGSQDSDLRKFTELTLTAVKVANLVDSNDKPEIAWLSRSSLDELEAVLGPLKQRYDSYNLKKSSYRDRKALLLEKYDESFLQIDHSEMIDAFSSFLFRSPLRYLNSKYYRYKRLILNTCRSSSLDSEVLDHLVEAREILRLGVDLENSKPTNVSYLGRFDRAEDTDFSAIERSIARARDLLSATSEPLSREILGLLAMEHPPTDFKRTIEKSETLIHFLESGIGKYKTLLPSKSQNGVQIGISEVPLHRLAIWAEQAYRPLVHFAKNIDAVLAVRVTNQCTIPSLIEDLLLRQNVIKTLSLIEEEGHRLKEKFGTRFCGIDTNWDGLLEAINWTGRIRKLFASSGSSLLITDEFIEKCATGSIIPPLSLSQIVGAINEADEGLRLLQTNFKDKFPNIDRNPLAHCEFHQISDRLELMIRNLDALRRWTDHQAIAFRLKEIGLGSFIEEFKKAGLGADQLVPAIRTSFFRHWLTQIYEANPRLGEFNSARHEGLIREFKDADRQLVKLASQRVVESCSKNRPDSSYFASSQSEIGILRREAMKKKRHLPIRTLFKEIPNMLLKLKPCLMMSPLSVSQFLPSYPGGFDLLIFDEASQIFTEDAVGAIYRASQILVAGDNKQMPPTDFFRASDFEEDEVLSEPAVASSADYASVLDEIQTIDGIDVCHLRWHYRSKHESLIAFSNHRFYSNKLVTFPGTIDKSPNLGVHFHYVSDGIYDRGGKRINQREAECVADLVFDHFRKTPGKSLGVVAFSQAQMVAIDDEIERRRAIDPQFEDFFNDDRLEGFFVKNLENVQGDERDVIFFSVGYGRDSQGRLSMNFGPLNRDGGERRLNVAVTRAREKVVLVSSIKAGDIDLGATSSSGVLNFHKYLEYAERGISALVTDQPTTTGEPESPLEEDIAAEIRSLGYEVIHQVGCSGYRIDMGVLSPERPGEFILGIEADGATYHSAQTARDRDRLRQQVLESLGWRIHRVWSTDWISQRGTEVERLREALSQAVSDPNGRSPLSKPVDEVAIVKVSRELTELDLPPDVHKYEMAEIPTGKFYGTDFHSSLYFQEKIDLLQKIVALEGPIHLEVAARRLIKGWLLERVTERVSDKVMEIARLCSRKQIIKIKGDFLYSLDNLIHAENLATFPVRVPDDRPEAQREIRFISPEEVQAAILLVLKYALSLPEELLYSETRKLFGFKRSGDQIRDRLAGELKTLIKRQLVVRDGGKIVLASFLGANNLR